MFGSQQDLRAAIRRRLASGTKLLARVEAARAETDAMPLDVRELPGLAGALGRIEYLQSIEKVEDAIVTWLSGNVRALRQYLASSADRVRVTYVAERGDAGRALSQRLTAAEQAVHAGRSALEEVLALVPASKPAILRPAEERFAELREIGLIEEAALRPLLRRMSRLASASQVSDAIGAAKELVEACNRAACDLLNIEAPTDSFPRLGKAVRMEIARRDVGATTPKAKEAIDQLFAGMATIENALAALRNELGVGHGRPKVPNLRPRHGQLAVDTADMHARYLACTLRDLGLL